MHLGQKSICPLNGEGIMPQKGEGKQIPEDQRSRGKNPEHPEGQDNLRNEQEQKASPPPPTPRTGS
jgi:hypothetical protein